MFKKNRFFAGTIALIVIFSFLLAFVPLGQIEAAQDIPVFLNGERLSFDQTPLIKDGRVLVPLRGIFEALGAEVKWDSTAKTVFSEKDGVSVKLTIGQKTAYVNNRAVELDVPAQIVNGRTLVPLRFVSESLGAKVNWDGANKIVTITSTPTSTPTPTPTPVPTPAPIVSKDIVISSVNLETEVVVIKNTGSKAVDISGWKLVSEVGNQQYVIPSGTVIQPGGSLKIVSGKNATAGAGTLVWTTQYIWNNDGDAAALYDKNGNLVSKYK